MGGLFELLAALLFLVLLGGAVLGWVSLLAVGRLRERVARLEATLHRLDPSAGRPVTGEATEAPERWSAGPALAAATHPGDEPVEHGSAPVVAAESPRVTPPGSGAGRAQHAIPAAAAARHLREHWMVWLGGLCIGLAGVFLVRHSIEQGHLGPTARVLLGMLTGLALHVLAEWARRRFEGNYDAIAALAGGASLTLYAAVLAALHLYAIWPPLVVFALLALVSFGTMLLALRHGPILAILGMLGAFAVPALLGGDAAQLLPVLVYSLIVTVSALVLMRHVYRDWLWWSAIAGALFWWWVALQAGTPVVGWLGVYLGVLGWSLLALRWGNYRLTNEQPAKPATDWRHWLHHDASGLGASRAALLVLLCALAYGVAVDPLWGTGFWVWLPLPVVILVASRYNEGLRVFPWLTLAALCAGLLGSAVDWRPMAMPPWLITPVDLADEVEVLVALGLLGALFSAGGAWHGWQRRDVSHAASLAFMAPLVVLAMAYVLAPMTVSHWMLSAACLAVGAAFGGLAAQRLRQRRADTIAFWQVTAGHFAYSLAAVISLDQATLTLALAVQVLSLTWLIRRFEVRHLDWLVKLVLAAVLVRLTLNPWLLEYDSGVHWTLSTYGGSLVVVWMGGLLVAGDKRLALWFRAGALHLLILFLHTETRYWLYSGDVFAARYDFAEAALNTGLWAALALVYHWRAQAGSEHVLLYRNVAGILMLAAVAGYLMLLTVMNPLWNPASATDIGGTPVFNLLLLAYGLPVALWALASRFYEPDLRGFFALLAGMGLWVFLTLEIRHLWQGQIDFTSVARDGELYTYSVVWLLLAVSVMLFGVLRGRTGMYRGGMLLLALVILKIFFVDMSGLTGLLRALSFMGLGLSLLGLAFVHQYLARRRAAVRPAAG